VDPARTVAAAGALPEPRAEKAAPGHDLVQIRGKLRDRHLLQTLALVVGDELGAWQRLADDPHAGKIGLAVGGARRGR